MKILSLPVLAQLNSTGIALGDVGYGGTGCPQGSLQLVYAPSDTRYAPTLPQPPRYASASSRSQKLTKAEE